MKLTEGVDHSDETSNATSKTQSRPIEWAELGFHYRQPPFRFQAVFENGSWSEGELIEGSTIEIEEGACAIHYGQQCFEGLKSYPDPDGEPLLFRPEQNAARMGRSAERLLAPPPPEELFLRGVKEAVRANRALLPPPGLGATLYVRPFLIGVGHNLGLRPATRYVFRVFCCPVGPYFKEGRQGISLLVPDHDRAAPRGTGYHKLGGNYAGGLLVAKEAKERGFNDVLYLDALERRYVEETSGANVFGILPGDPTRFVTPKSESVLPSITMDSLRTIAADDLGLQVEVRQVPVEEVATFAEMGCTGTAAVITPVARVHYEGTDYAMSAAPGPVTQQLYDRLTGIQFGRLEDTRGWVVRV